MRNERRKEIVSSVVHHVLCSQHILAHDINVVLSKRLLALRDSLYQNLARVGSLIDIVEVEDLRIPAHALLEAAMGRVTRDIHHDLPGIDRQISIVE